MASEETESDPLYEYMSMEDPATEEDSLERNVEDDSFVNVDVQLSAPNPKRSRNRRSTVWKFMKIVKEHGNGQLTVKCKLCRMVFTCDGGHGTSNFRRHLRFKCVERSKAIKIFSPLVGQKKDRTIGLDQVAFREALSMSIIRHEYPFQYVEHEGTRNVFSILNSEVRHISRNTVKADILKMFTKEKKKLRRLVQSAPGRISLTSDMWSSPTTDGYMCITAHFVDTEWKLHKKILSFLYMPAPHTGFAIATKFSELMTTWSIEDKLFSVTLDNASANTTFCDLYESRLNLKTSLLLGGCFFRVRCCAHILNLVVQDGLKVVDEAVHKIRETVKYLKNSQWRKEQFVECLDKLGLAGPRRLRQDVSIRWNSTYLMIERALTFRLAFSDYELVDPHYKLCPSDEEWFKVEKISKFLSLFYELTNKFSGSYYPTANLYFEGVWKIKLHLKEALVSNHEFLRNMAEKMNDKFDKYWSDFSDILSIAVVLDPRYKMKMIEYSYTKLYGRDRETRISRLREQLLLLFNEYVPSSSDLIGSSATTQDVEVDSECEDVMAGFDTFQCEVVIGKKSQLDLYLEEACLDRTEDFNILMYWQSMEYRFPYLAKMARDVLAIPISTVASESAFSTGGRVLDQYRTSLAPSTVEALVCTKDWLFGSNVVITTDDDLEVDLLVGSSTSTSTSTSTVTSRASISKRTKPNSQFPTRMSKKSRTSPRLRTQFFI